MHDNLISYVSHYKPAIVVVYDFDENNDNNIAHAMVLLGYVKNPNNINNTKFLIYDVLDGEYLWEDLYEFLDGTMEIDERAGFAVIYSI